MQRRFTVTGLVGLALCWSVWWVATVGSQSFESLSTNVNQTISATHTLNPTAVGPPLIIGANASGQSVAGLRASVANDADLLGGQNSAYFRDATNLNAGTVADVRLSANIPRKDQATTFTTGPFVMSGSVTRATVQNVNQGRADVASGHGLVLQSAGVNTTTASMIGGIFWQSMDSDFTTSPTKTVAYIAGLGRETYASDNAGASALTFGTAGLLPGTGAFVASEKMRITENGDIGINTTAPTAQLHVKSALATRIPMTIDTAPSSVDEILNLTNNGAPRFKFFSDGAMHQYKDDNVTTWRLNPNGAGGDYEISPSPTTGTFRISLSGPSAATLNLALTDGTLSVGNLAAVGTDPLCWDGSGASLVGDCTSLLMYKNNVADLSLGLSTVMALQPRSFTWTSEMGGKDDLGFVAEEVEAVAPLLASYANYGTDTPTGEHLVGVKYDKFVALLTNAIQEQQAMIATLQAQVTALEAFHP